MMAGEIPPHTISDMANLSVMPSPYVQCIVYTVYVQCSIQCVYTMYMYMYKDTCTRIHVQ